MTDTFDLFRQAKKLKYQLPTFVPEPIIQQPKRTLHEILSETLGRFGDAHQVGNTYQAVQHLAAFVDIVTDAVAENGFDVNGVLGQLSILEELDDEDFTGILNTEVRRTLDTCVMYTSNIKNYLGLENHALAQFLLKKEQFFGMVFSADDTGSVHDLLQCAGTYLRLRLIVRFQAFENDIFPLYEAAFEELQDKTIEDAQEKYGDNFIAFAMGYLKLMQDQELSPSDAYNVASAIQNAVRPLFIKGFIRDNIVVWNAPDEAIKPSDIKLDIVKKGDPNIVFIISPLTDNKMLEAIPFRVPLALQTEGKGGAMTVITRPMFPEFEE